MAHSSLGLAAIFFTSTVVGFRDRQLDFLFVPALGRALFLRLWQRAIASWRKLDVSGDRHSFAVLELLTLGKLGLEGLIECH